MLKIFEAILTFQKTLLLGNALTEICHVGLLSFFTAHTLAHFFLCTVTPQSVMHSVRNETAGAQKTQVMVRTCIGAEYWKLAQEEGG